MKGKCPTALGWARWLFYFGIVVGSSGFLRGVVAEVAARGGGGKWTREGGDSTETLRPW